MSNIVVFTSLTLNGVIQARPARPTRTAAAASRTVAGRCPTTIQSLRQRGLIDR